MKVVLFLDLDDTVFQTLPKCPVGEPARPVAFRRDRTPLSFMTERQRTLLEGLFASATVIPTTARNLDAFRRVDLAFAHAAILDFGGVVLLPDGKLDRGWDAQVILCALDMAAELRQIQAAIQRFSERHRLNVNARVIGDFDMSLYVVVKQPDGDGSRLDPIEDDLRQTFDKTRFFLHRNDNNLSLVPRFLGKERAVQHVLNTCFDAEPVLTIGMGDSLTDLPFLQLCDFTLMPRGCQLARSGFPSSRDS